MHILAVDDEELALEYLMRILRQAQPDSVVSGFTDPFAALEYLEAHPVDVTFLDVEMRGMNGIELARRCKKRQPDIRLVFVTGYPHYAIDAFSVRASGYLLKPASAESVREELDNLRLAPQPASGRRLRVHTFGNFEVYADGRPLVFARAKSKELFAYLVDRKGAGCTTAALSALLWEDKEYTVSLQKQFQTVVSDMFKALKSAGFEEAVIRTRNQMAVNPDMLDCDYYRFLEGDVRAINAYTGEYMANYSWAEFTTGYLCRSEPYTAPKE